MRKYPYLTEEKANRIIALNLEFSESGDKTLMAYASSIRSPKEASTLAMILDDVMMRAGVGFVMDDQATWAGSLRKILASAAFTRSQPFLFHLGSARKIHMIAALHLDPQNEAGMEIVNLVVDRTCCDTEPTLDNAQAMIMAHLALSNTSAAIKEALDLIGKCQGKELDRVECVEGEAWARLVLAMCDADQTGMTAALHELEEIRDKENKRGFKRFFSGGNSLTSCIDLWDGASSAILSLARRKGMAIEANRYVDPSWAYQAS